MRPAEAQAAERRRDHEIIGSFPALPARPAAPVTVAQAVVFQLYPNEAQAQVFGSWIGAGRWVWNRFVEHNQARYAETKTFAFHKQLSELLPQWKEDPELAWLKEPPAIHLVDVSRRYDAALRRFLSDRKKVASGTLSRSRAAGFPKFKSKRDGEGSIYLSSQSIELIRRHANDRARGWVEISNLDETVVWSKGTKTKTVGLRRAVRIRGGRWPEGTIRSATIRRDGEIWTLSVQFDGPVPDRQSIPVPELEAVGLDLGVGYLVVGSDGTRVVAGRGLRRAQNRLRRDQRKLSRRVLARKRREAIAQKERAEAIARGEPRDALRITRSRGERDARARVAATHRQVRRRRSDLIHQFTHRATAKAAVICVEDLNVAGMTRNKHLALSVSDAGMGEVARQLAYKSAWRGRSFVKIDRFAPSSKTCSSCGHVQEGLELGHRRWTCASCGESHDRDENASLNVLRWGLTNLLRRGTPNVKPVESGALAARPTRKGKGLRRNSARRSGNMADPHDLVSCGQTP